MARVSKNFKFAEPVEPLMFGRVLDDVACACGCGAPQAMAASAFGVGSIAKAAATKVSTVDALLSGVKWNGASLTYSLPTKANEYGSSVTETKSNFAPVTSEQSRAIADALGQVSAFSNLSFTPVSGGEGVLRFGQSDAPSTAYAYLPNSAEQGGDVWFRNSGPTYDNPTKGSYAYHTVLHELGHALGLKHAHEAYGGFGALSGAANSMEYTVMTYASYAGARPTGYTNEATSFAQSYMMYDIAALQKLYGADFTTNAGDTLYSWDPKTGEMFVNGISQGDPAGDTIFLTIWDGGGKDTYIASNYTTDVVIDLNPGKWSTFDKAQLADLSGRGKLAAGNVANALQYDNDPRSLIENAVGGSGADKITGNKIANHIAGGAGNDILDGQDGDDTLFGSAGSDRLIGGSGTDTIFHTDATSGVGVDMVKGGFLGDAKGDTYSGIEIVVGSHYDDFIYGGAAAETLRGSAGRDVLRGGGGADRLIGGSEVDRFVYSSLADSGLGAARDIIEDFVRGDIIDVSGIDADAKLAGDQAFSLIKGTTFTAPGQLIVYTERVAGATHTIIAGNTDTDAAAEFQIALLGAISLQAIDFLL